MLLAVENLVEMSQVLCGRVLSLKLKSHLKVDTIQMKAAEIRMMCGKTLCDGILNGLLRIEHAWKI